MQTAQIHPARYVGVAPGTTTFSVNGRRKRGALGGAGGYPPYPPPAGGPGVPPYPTQAWLIPQPSDTDRLKIAMPPNQQVTGPREMIVSMPAAQKNMGPVPNDRQSARSADYLPVHRGWIHTEAGNIFTLQGYGQSVKFEGVSAEGDDKIDWHKWAVVASLIGAVAVAATSTIAILEYRRRRR